VAHGRPDHHAVEKSCVLTGGCKNVCGPMENNKICSPQPQFAVTHYSVKFFSSPQHTRLNKPLENFICYWSSDSYSEMLVLHSHNSAVHTVTL
jgi:hypothetical protein